jgi:hypothetical protein
VKLSLELFKKDLEKFPRNPYEKFNDIHPKDSKLSPKIHLEAQKTENSQGNTEHKEQCWIYHKI